MDSKGLTPDQLHALALQLEKHSRYLNRLRQRMVDLGFSHEDELFGCASDAAAAVEHLVYRAWEEQRRAASLYRKPRRAEPQDPRHQ